MRTRMKRGSSAWPSVGFPWATDMECARKRATTMRGVPRFSAKRTKRSANSPVSCRSDWDATGAFDCAPGLAWAGRVRRSGTFPLGGHGFCCLLLVVRNGVRTCDVCGTEIPKGDTYAVNVIVRRNAGDFMGSMRQNPGGIPTFTADGQGNLTLEICLNCKLKISEPAARVNDFETLL
jgi:hypothetical protein